MLRNKKWDSEVLSTQAFKSDSLGLDYWVRCLLTVNLDKLLRFFKDLISPSIKLGQTRVSWGFWAPCLMNGHSYTNLFSQVYLRPWKVPNLPSPPTSKSLTNKHKLWNQIFIAQLLFGCRWLISIICIKKYQHLEKLSFHLSDHTCLAPVQRTQNMWN